MSQTKITDLVAGNASLDTMVELDANAYQPKIEVVEQQPEPPPNGGLTAWLQVAGSFFLFFNCWYVRPLTQVTCKTTSTYLTC